MFSLNRCRACGKLHDDGGLFLVGGKTVMLCMDCSDNAPESEDDRVAWLNEIFDFEPEEMLAEE